MAQNGQMQSLAKEILYRKFDQLSRAAHHIVRMLPTW